jgi:hypothetical protein
MEHGPILYGPLSANNLALYRSVKALSPHFCNPLRIGRSVSPIATSCVLSSAAEPMHTVDAQRSPKPEIHSCGSNHEQKRGKKEEAGRPFIAEAISRNATRL